MKKNGWGAIRKNEEGEWIDSYSFDLLPDECRKRAGITDAQIPHWAKTNPIQRIVPCAIVITNTE